MIVATFIEAMPGFQMNGVRASRCGGAGLSLGSLEGSKQTVKTWPKVETLRDFERSLLDFVYLDDLDVSDGLLIFVVYECMRRCFQTNSVSRTETD